MEQLLEEVELEFDDRGIAVAKIKDVGEFQFCNYQDCIIGWSMDKSRSETMMIIIRPKILDAFETREIYYLEPNLVLIEKLIVQGLQKEEKRMYGLGKSFANEKIPSPSLKAGRKKYYAICQKVKRRIDKLADELYGNADATKILAEETADDKLKSEVDIMRETVLKEAKEAKEAKLESDKKKNKTPKKVQEDFGVVAANLNSSFAKASISEEQNPIGNFKVAVVDKPLIEDKTSPWQGQTDRAAIKEEVIDLYETLPRDLEPLLRFLDKKEVIYEPCAGNNAIANFFRDRGFSVFASDKFFGDDKVDFLANENHPFFDVLITNPPFKNKADFIEVAYKLGKKFIMMLPLEAATGVSCRQLLRGNGFAIGFPNPVPKFLHEGKELSYGVGGCAWFFGGNWPFVKQNPDKDDFFNFFFLDTFKEHPTKWVISDSPTEYIDGNHDDSTIASEESFDEDN
jgi:hypothetical protein